MRTRAKRIVRNLVGFVLLGLGIAGLFLPGLQGILLILIGFGMLDLPVKHRLVAWLKTNPRTRVFFRRISLHHPHEREGTAGSDPPGDPHGPKPSGPPSQD